MAAKRSAPTNAITVMTRRMRRVGENGSLIGVGVEAIWSVAGGVHAELLIVLWIIVTAPFRANARPWSVAPFFSAIEVRAMIVPLKLVVVPKVAELPICQ